MGGWAFGCLVRLVVWWVSPDIFVEFAVVVVVGSDAGADGNANVNSDCTTIFRAAAFVEHCATSEFGSSHQQDDN